MSVDLRALKKKFSDDPALLDVHRPLPKSKGGKYEKGNINILSPIEHMKIHGNYRERSEKLEKLKALVDDREQVMKLVNKINNQLKAVERRTDFLSPDTIQFLKKTLKECNEELKQRTKAVEKFCNNNFKDELIFKAVRTVKGIGPLTIAPMLVYVDPEKAKYPSSVWKYTGLHCPSHKRYQKGKTSGGNKNLRTALYRFAEDQLRLSRYNPGYLPIYHETRERLANSDKIVETWVGKGKLEKRKWKDTKPSHQHGAAFRAMIKCFLADWWYVSRKLSGLPTPQTYAQAILGKNDSVINPSERGWTLNHE